MLKVGQVSLSKQCRPDQTKGGVRSGSIQFVILSVLLVTSKDSQTDLVKLYVKYVWSPTTGTSINRGWPWWLSWMHVQLVIRRWRVRPPPGRQHSFVEIWSWNIFYGHSTAWSLITRVPLWGPLGGPLCRWPCYHRWIAWGMCQEALDLKGTMEKKGLRVNAGKTMIMICGMGLDLLQSSGEFPCAVCRTGVGSNSIFCNGCKHWVHKKCSGLKRLKKDPDYRCTRCQGTARPLDGRPQKEVQVGPDKLDVVASFCYLGDMLSAADGCELSTTTCVKTAWKKFKDLLPVLSSCHLSFKTRGHVYNSCVRSAMLLASETWPLTKPNLQRLQQNDRAMIRQICNVSPQDIVTTRSNELLVRLGIEDLDLILKVTSDGMDLWNAPVVQSRQPLTYRLMESVGLEGPKWHGSSWQRRIAESRSSRLSTLMIDVSGDLVWDLPCVQQANYLEGGPLMWMLPLYLHINQKSNYDDYDYDMMILSLPLIQEGQLSVSGKRMCTYWLTA